MNILPLKSYSWKFCLMNLWKICILQIVTHGEEDDMETISFLRDLSLLIGILRLSSILHKVTITFLWGFVRRGGFRVY